MSVWFFVLKYTDDSEGMGLMVVSSLRVSCLFQIPLLIAYIGRPFIIANYHLLVKNMLIYLYTLNALTITHRITRCKQTAKRQRFICSLS